MKDLIKALEIFLKYGNPESPTNCSHDELWINIDPKLVSKSDKAKLRRLGFFVSDDGYSSFRFGSC